MLIYISHRVPLQQVSVWKGLSHSSEHHLLEALRENGHKAIVQHFIWLLEYRMFLCKGRTFKFRFKYFWQRYYRNYSCIGRTPPSKHIPFQLLQQTLRYLNGTQRCTVWHMVLLFGLFVAFTVISGTLINLKHWHHHKICIRTPRGLSHWPSTYAYVCSMIACNTFSRQHLLLHAFLSMRTHEYF